MVLKYHNIFITINKQETKLPIFYNSYVTSAQDKFHGLLLRLGIAFTSLNSLGFFWNLRTDTDNSSAKG